MNLFKKIFLPSEKGLKETVRILQNRVDGFQKNYDWAKGVLSSRKQQLSSRPGGGKQQIEDSKKQVKEYKARLDKAKEDLKKAKQKLRDFK